jgi:hypothetical protein
MVSTSKIGIKIKLKWNEPSGTHWCCETCPAVHALSEGIALHFRNYIEYFPKSKLYVFPKIGENCLRSKKIFRKIKKISKKPLPTQRKRGIV